MQSVFLEKYVRVFRPVSRPGVKTMSREPGLVLREENKLIPDQGEET